MSLSFKIMNIEQGISNDEVEINFEIHYSLFDIRYFLKPEAKTAATQTTKGQEFRTLDLSPCNQCIDS